MESRRMLADGPEQEARLVIKDEGVNDQPLDFSRKDTLPNHRTPLPKITALASIPDEEALRKLSNDSGISVSSMHGGAGSRPVTPSNGDDSKALIGEPRVSLPMQFMSQASMAAGMGLFCPPGGLPGGFPGAFMPNFGAMWQNPMAAALMQQQQEAARKAIQAANGTGGIKTSNRPFKQYPKDPLNFPLCSMPSMFPSAGSNIFSNGMMPDASTLAEALKSHEQMFNVYKQQVLSQKAAEEAKKGHRKSSGQSHTQSAEPVNCHLLTTAPSARSSSSHSNSSDDDKHSVSSGKSSMYGEACTPQPSVSDETGQQSVTPTPSLAESEDSQHPKRKNAIVGLSPQIVSPVPSTCSVAVTSTTPNGSSMVGSLSSSIGRKRSRNHNEEQKICASLDSSCLLQDDAYWERRRKNNEAAKRSRDSRRAKEDEIAIRAAFLEQENLRLRVEVAALRQQTAKLRSELVMCQSPIDQHQDNTPADGS